MQSLHDYCFDDKPTPIGVVAEMAASVLVLLGTAAVFLPLSFALALHSMLGVWI